MPYKVCTRAFVSAPWLHASRRQMPLFKVCSPRRTVYHTNAQCVARTFCRSCSQIVTKHRKRSGIEAHNMHRRDTRSLRQPSAYMAIPVMWPSSGDGQCPLCRIPGDSVSGGGRGGCVIRLSRMACVSSHEGYVHTGDSARQFSKRDGNIRTVPLASQGFILRLLCDDTLAPSGVNGLQGPHQPHMIDSACKYGFYRACTGTAG